MPRARCQRSKDQVWLSLLSFLFFLFFVSSFSPKAESFGVSAQIGSGVVWAALREGSTRRGFYHGSTKVALAEPGFYQVLQGLQGGPTIWWRLGGTLAEPYLKPPCTTPQLLQSLVEPWWKFGRTLAELSCNWWNPGGTLVEPCLNPPRMLRIRLSHIHITRDPPKKNTEHIFSAVVEPMILK